MEGHKSVIRNILSLSGVQIANYVFPLLTVPIISRIIGPEKYGIINFCLSFVLYFSLFISYGFDLTATRKIAKDPGNRYLRCVVFSEVFKTQLFLLAISTIVFLVCLYSVPLLHKEKMVAIFSFLCCFSTVFTQNWLFQAMQELSKVAIMQFVSKLLFTVFILVAVRKPEDYVWQPLVVSGSLLLVSILSFFWSIKRYRIRYLLVSNARMFGILKQERMVFFSLAVISIYTTTNSVILGFLRTSLDVGYYTAAQNLMRTITSVLSGPLSQALFPFIGLAFAKGLKEGITVVRAILPLVFYITFGMAIVLFVVGPFVLRIFYGPLFIPSIKVFQILCIVPLIVSMSNVFGIQVMLNLKMDKAFFKITSVGAVLGLILNTLMTIKWGYVGTAFNWIIVECYITLAMYFHLRSQKIELLEWHKFAPSVVFKQLRFGFGDLKKKI